MSGQEADHGASRLMFVPSSMATTSCDGDLPDEFANGELFYFSFWHFKGHAHNHRKLEQRFMGGFMTVFQRFSQTGRMSAKWMSTVATRCAVPVIVCLLMLATAGVASATTYWVSPNGSDSNAGTSQSAPFLTFQAAANIATTPGDTVVFMDGTYSMACNPNTGHPVSWCDAAVLANQGTANAPITFMAQHRGKAILDGEAGNGWSETNGTWSCSGAHQYLYLRTARYVVIQGFSIQNTCYSPVIDNDVAQNITLRWNDISNAGLNLPATPVTGAASDSVGGFYCGGPSIGGASGVVLDGNSIHDINANPSVGSWSDHALYINCPNVTIINNIFYNIDNGYDIQLAGVEASGQEGAGNVLIANNTFGPTDPMNSNPNDAELYSEVVVWRGSASGSISGVAIQNNIFDEPRQNAIEGESPNVNNCVINTNLVSNNAGMYYAAGTPGAGCTVGANLVDIDPGMVDPAKDNFELLPWSQAIDAGVTLGYVTTDFARACRPQGSAYDIGAYEHVDMESYNRCRGWGFNFSMSHPGTN